MESLKRINKELETARDALMYDQETIATYARDLGYSRRNERFIRIVGLEGKRKTHTEAGELLLAQEPEHISDVTIKIIAFAIGAGLFLCMWIPDFLETQQQQRRTEPNHRSYAGRRQADGAPFYRKG
jgi:hypothetical protein